MKDADSLAGGGGWTSDRARKSILRIQNKTFYLRSGIYIDSSIEAEELKNAGKVKFLSKEYMELLEINPDASKYLAVDSFLILKLSGKVYFIHDYDQ